MRGTQTFRQGAPLVQGDWEEDRGINTAISLLSLSSLFSPGLPLAELNQNWRASWGWGIHRWSCCKSAFLCRAREKWAQSRFGEVSSIPSTRGRERENVEATSLVEWVGEVGEGRTKTYCVRALTLLNTHIPTHALFKTKETQCWDLLVLKSKGDIFRHPLLHKVITLLSEENKLIEIQTLMRS